MTLDNLTVTLVGAGLGALGAAFLWFVRFNVDFLKLRITVWGVNGENGLKREVYTSKGKIDEYEHRITVLESKLSEWPQIK